LLRIRQPVTAVVSFGHRVSGVVLALLVPVAAWLLQRSLRDANGFDFVASLLGSVAGRFGVVIVTWALAHHVLAGVRHLLFDLHVATGTSHRDEGSRPRQPRTSAWLVLVGEGVIVLATIVALA
jgi:succinate dehydrogenase / fumarate reductase cytochrome b subunit